MRTKPLGKTGIEVSELGFGALFASSLGQGVETARQAVYKAVDLGVNYFDTAPAYADSEAVFGSILADVKAPIILSTKLGGRPVPFDPRDAKALEQSVTDSLRLLHREVIDVLFIHEPDRPLQYDWWADTARAQGPVVAVMETLKKKGLVRFTGLAGTTVTEMAHLVRAGSFDVLLSAFNYSPLFREAAEELLPAAREKGMGVVLGSVLHQGALGRRFDAVVRARPTWMSRARQRQLLAFYALLDESGIPLVELALRFATGSPLPSTVLIGPKTARHVEESVAAVEKGPLPADILRRLDEIAALVPYRPFEEPMILPLADPSSYTGPGMANLGAGIQVGKLDTNAR